MAAQFTVAKPYERQAKLKRSQGALWDIGIVFRGSLYRFAVFGACTYDMVIHTSEIYIKLQLSVFMIAGSYCGFLSNAGHVQTACCGHHGTYKDLREAMGNLLGTQCFRDHIVSIRVLLGYRFGYCLWHAVGPGKKRKKLESNSNL